MKFLRNNKTTAIYKQMTLISQDPRNLQYRLITCVLEIHIQQERRLYKSGFIHRRHSEHGVLIPTCVNELQVASLCSLRF